MYDLQLNLQCLMRTAERETHQATATKDIVLLWPSVIVYVSLGIKHSVLFDGVGELLTKIGS